MAAAGADGRQLRARGHRTRGRLLDAGAEVFSDKGLHAARVDDIVRLAETSHATFYLYFSSKEDLFGQLVAEAGTELEALVAGFPPVRDTEHSRAQLRVSLDRFVDIYERYGGVIRTWTESELSDDGAPAGLDMLSHLAIGLAGTVRLPKRSGLDPTVGAIALMALCERLTYFASSGQVKVTREELLDTLLDIIDDAVYGE